MKILLIEDNQDNADLFIKWLHMNDYPEVTHKLTGIDGLTAARSGDYDVIMIDFDLPDVPGTQVGLSLATLILLKQLKPARLIALTAQSDKTSQDEAEQMGFDAFIGKPCLDSDVIDTLRHVSAK